MKKLRKICVLLCAIFILWGDSISVFAEDIQTGDSKPAEQAVVSSGCHSADAQLAMLGNAQLITNAQSVFLYERSSETLMYAWNADAQIYPSSLVKIMTGWIVAEKGKMDEIITVKESVLATVPANAVSSKLQVDEVITVGDLLYCMMVGSGNDAAAVLSDHIAGDQEAFVREMNEKAVQLGCTGTQFTNVHGLHDKDQYTTARDACRILDAALENETFRSIFTTATYTVPQTNKSEARELITGNYLMTLENDVQIYYDPRVTGGRTGIANDGTRCLAATAESDGMELISIVMGAKSVYRDDGYTVQIFGGYTETRQLFDAGFDGYRAVQILHPGQIMLRRDVAGSTEKLSIGTRESCTVVLPDGVTSGELSYRYNDIAGSPEAPIKQGTPVSNLQVWYGNICVAQTDLYAMNSVFAEKTAQIERIDEDNIDAWKTVLIVVLVAACVVIGVLIGLRIVAKVNLVKVRRHSRQHRRNRRRSR